MGGVPAQTRGFLFSDLRGYSAFTERHGDRAARELLVRYRHIVREAVASFGGAEIRTEGDSFYVVFDSVSQAVEAGLAIQAGLVGDTAGEPIRAGIGIHAGEVEDDAEHGIVSSAVNIAARICAMAEPGEVLVSETVHALTRGYLQVGFMPRGRRRLKGIRDAVALYRVGARSTPSQPRRWPALGLAVATLTVLVLVVAVVGGAMIREGLGSAQSPPARDADSSPAASNEGYSASGSSPDATSAAAEHSLLRLVGSSYQSRCQPAEPGTLPVHVGPGPRGVGDAPTEGRRDPAFSAGIVCEPFQLKDPDEVGYWIVADYWIEGGAEELIRNRAGVIGAPTGSCAEDRRALEPWTSGPLSGYLLCFSTESGGATLYWTYQGSDVFGKAVRLDGDMDALLRWWNEQARLRRP